MDKQTLADAVQDYGHEALLLTVGDGRPHTCVVEVALEGRVVTCVPSKTAAKNMRLAPDISLIWPAKEPGGYAIIANGLSAPDRAADASPAVTIKLTKTVLHRSGPKPAGGPGPCPSDCIELI